MLYSLHLSLALVILKAFLKTEASKCKRIMSHDLARHCRC